jgi:hypothetical protein
MPLPDIDDIDTFGGQHVDAHQQEDPTTDLTAAQFDKLSCDVAMSTHTAIRAWVRFIGITYTSGTMVIVPTDHNAVWGSGTSVRPVVDQTAAGVYHATWAATQTDQLGVVHTLNIRAPLPMTVFGADTLRAKVVSTTANVLTINAFSGGALNSLNGTAMIAFWI